MTQTATAATSCLRPVPNGTATLAACKGSRLVSEATGTFAGYIDGDFVRWGADGPTPDTPETPFTTDELVADADFATMFAGSAFFTPSQLVQFCDDHRDKLSRSGATFVPLQVGDNRFVARVCVDGRGLEVLVLHFSLGYVWSARYGYRVVRPQNI